MPRLNHSVKALLATPVPAAELEPQIVPAGTPAPNAAALRAAKRFARRPVATESWFGLKPKTEPVYGNPPALNDGVNPNTYRHGKWAIQSVHEIGQTYANHDWVAKHIREKANHNERLVNSLSYKGKLITPPAALLHKAVELSKKMERESWPKLERYYQQLAELRKEVQAQLDAGDDPQVVLPKALVKARAIKLPFDVAVPGPQWFGGRTVAVHGPTELDYQASPKAFAKGELPSLTVDEIVAAGKLIAELANHAYVESGAFAERLDAIMEDGTNWLDGDDVLDHDELMDLLDTSYMPHQQVELAYEYSRLLFDTCDDVGKWLYAMIDHQVSK